MPKLYARLRGEMVARDIDQAYLARKLLIGRSSVAERLRARYPWTIDEMYQVMDLICWPYDKMHELFPRVAG